MLPVTERPKPQEFATTSFNASLSKRTREIVHDAAGGAQAVHESALPMVAITSVRYPKLWKVNGG